MKKQISHYAAIASLALLLISIMVSPASASDYRGSGSPDFLYYMEGTSAYFLPDPEVDIFFSLGRWYRRSGGSWSASVSLSGPWGAVTVGHVPPVLVALPMDFRTTYRFGQVPYVYVVGSGREHDDYGPRHYSGEYYDDHGRRGYRRNWHPAGGFWFYIAPGLDHDDRHDRDDDGHRRRGRGRGRD